MTGGGVRERTESKNIKKDCHLFGGQRGGKGTLSVSW